jgi:hypothetical protein
MSDEQKPKMQCEKENWPDEACLECDYFHVSRSYAWNPYAKVHCFKRQEIKYGHRKKSVPPFGV